MIEILLQIESIARVESLCLWLISPIHGKHFYSNQGGAIMQTMILTPFFKLTPLEKGKVEISELSTPLKTNYLKNRR